TDELVGDVVVGDDRVRVHPLASALVCVLTGVERFADPPSIHIESFTHRHLLLTPSYPSVDRMILADADRAVRLPTPVDILAVRQIDRRASRRVRNIVVPALYARDEAEPFLRSLSPHPCFGDLLPALPNITLSLKRGVRCASPGRRSGLLA